MTTDPDRVRDGRMALHPRTHRLRHPHRADLPPPRHADLVRPPGLAVHPPPTTTAETPCTAISARLPVSRKRHRAGAGRGG